MYSRIALAMLLIATTMPSAFAQSATATNFQTKPIQPPVCANGPCNTQNIPPAARSGEKGLRIGPGAMQGDQFVTIKRNK